MPSSRKQGWTIRGAFAPVIVLAVLLAAPAMASDAGTRIVNTATLRYEAGGTATATPSNTVTLILAERLDLTLVPVSTGPVARGAATAIPVVLTNTGNGHEAFVVTVSGAAGAPTVAIDRDGDGRYDPARDTVLVDGRTAELAPGAALALLVVAETGALPSGGGLTIAAAAVTGSGVPGTVVAGQGDGGGDAVVGPTGATAAIAVAVTAVASPTLVKTQSVRAPDGGSAPVRGAIVTYAIEAGFVVPADDARIDDPVPAGTRYVAGSLRLDDAALADPADPDTIRVELGAVPRSASHRIQFQVKIQ